MRKLAIIVLALSSILLISNSCKKYEDGPALSLKTKKARLAGTWTIEELKVNGVVYDLNQFQEEFGVQINSFVFKKDGNGEMVLASSIIQIPLNFTWEFASSKENLKTVFKALDIPGYELGMPFNNLELEILRLTNKEFWSRDVSSDNPDFRVALKLKKK